MPNCGYLNDLQLNNGLHIGQRIRGSTAVHLGQFFERAQLSIPAELFFEKCGDHKREEVAKHRRPLANKLVLGGISGGYCFRP
jgi:hypothetical protein